MLALFAPRPGWGVARARAGNRGSHVMRKDLVSAIMWFWCIVLVMDIEAIDYLAKVMPIKRELDVYEIKTLENMIREGSSIEDAGEYLCVGVEWLRERYGGVIRSIEIEMDGKVLKQLYEQALCGNMKAIELWLINRKGWSRQGKEERGQSSLRVEIVSRNELLRLSDGVV